MILLEPIIFIQVNKWRLFWIISGFFLHTINTFAQKVDAADSLLATSDFQFVGYLLDNKEFEDAVFVLNAMNRQNAESAARTDSINFFLGRAWYLQEKIDSSNKYFMKVAPGSSQGMDARCFYSFGKMYQAKFTDADSLLEACNFQDSSRTEFVRFMQASNALMQKDTLKFKQISSRFRFNQSACEWEQKQLPSRAKEVINNRRKSALLAGLMSAFVPGSGKYYAGYRGQAIASLIPCLVFGAATVESYFRTGPKSIPFITSGCLFGLFYIGNIWGSSFSVKTFYEQRNSEIRHRLLLGVQIPMHRLFGQ